MMNRRHFLATTAFGLVAAPMVRAAGVEGQVYEVTLTDALTNHFELTQAYPGFVTKVAELTGDPRYVSLSDDKASLRTAVADRQIADILRANPVVLTADQLAAALALGAEGVWCGSVWLTTATYNWGPRYLSRINALISNTWKADNYYGTIADGFTSLAQFVRSDDPKPE